MFARQKHATSKNQPTRTETSEHSTTKATIFCSKKLHKRGEIVYFAFFYLKSLLKKN